MKDTVGESNGLATEITVAEEEEMNLETEREVAIDAV